MGVIQRRTLLRDLGALLAAPAIVRASSLMALSAQPDPVITLLSWRIDDYTGSFPAMAALKRLALREVTYELNGRVYFWGRA